MKKVKKTKIGYVREYTHNQGYTSPTTLLKIEVDGHTPTDLNKIELAYEVEEPTTLIEWARCNSLDESILVEWLNKNYK